MTTTEEMLKIAQYATSIANTVTNTQNNAAELDALAKANEFNAIHEAKVKEFDANIIQDYNVQKQEYDNSVTDIVNSVNELELWGATEQDI